MPDVRIRTEGATGYVEVDGTDISSSVRSVQFGAAADEVPRLLVEVIPTRKAELELLGIDVDYVVLDDPAGWLRSIDPQLLERAALEGAGLGDPASAAELILKTLIRMAEGLDE